MLENINTKIEGLTSYINNQMSFNKMIETQIAQLAATIPVSSRKTLGQPEASLKYVKMSQWGPISLYVEKTTFIL